MAQPPGFIPDGFEPDAQPFNGPRLVKTDARIGPPTGNEPVTLGDLLDDPKAALVRSGHLLKQDLTDPKILGTLVAGWLLPKIAPAAGEVAAGAGRLGSALVKSAPDIAKVAMPHLSERVAAAQRVAQRVAGAVTPSEPVAPSPMAPAEASLGPSATPGLAGKPAAGPSVPAPAPATPAVTPSALPVSPVSKIWQAMEQTGLRLSDREMGQAIKLVQAGEDPAVVVRAITTARGQAASSPAELFRQQFGTDSDADVAAHFQRLYEGGQKTAPHR